MVGCKQEDGVFGQEALNTVAGLLHLEKNWNGTC